MKYVALLRTINVGGHEVIKVAEWRRMFEPLGLDDVQTYLQSRNVIFASGEDAELLEREMERQLEKATGHKIQVFVRTMRQVQSIAKKSPFTAKAQKTAYVVFLHQKLNKKQPHAT